MLPKELSSLLQKSKIFVYAWEYFSWRIHDELVRSVLDQSPFFYVEINFSIIEKELVLPEIQTLFWEALFDMLSKQKRNSDVCGFLKNDEGIAFMFLDSETSAGKKNSAWDRFCEQVQENASIDMRKWKGIIFGEYPPKEFFETYAEA